jgi:nitrate reductase NapE
MTEDEKLRKIEEWRTWLFLTVVLAPVVAVAVVGSYGLAVWLWQLFSGPATY